MGNNLQTLQRRPRSALHDYQVRASEFLKTHNEAGLFLDPGLGKTVITLTAIADLKALGEVRRVLVVGPSRVVATVWTREADLWEHTAHLTVLALTGTAEQRRQILVERLSKADVVCISYGLLGWLHQTVRRETWDWVVIEESSQVKNASTKRWKGVAYTALTAKRRTLLTGTPTPRSLADLWAQVTLADLGRRFGRSKKTFLSRYFLQTDYGWELLPGSRQALTAKLKDFAIALRAKDYLDLPALVETDVSVEMPASAWEIYTELARSFQVELADGITIDVTNAGVMAGKLAQISQGAIYPDDSGVWNELHTAKMEAVEGLVSELQGEPVLIAYWYRHDRDRLQARFPEAPVLGSGMSTAGLNALIDAWNRGEIPILLLHPASSGYGLNLQAGGRHLIWLALPWSWELVHQTTARLYRQGQTKPVMVYRILCARTIDERIARVLAERQEGHDTLIAALKAEVRQTVSHADQMTAARVAMQRAHPDRGGSDAAFIAARQVYERVKAEGQAA